MLLTHTHTHTFSLPCPSALVVSDISVVGDEGETVGVVVVGGPGGVDTILNPGVTMGTVGGGVTVEVVGAV